MAKADISVIIPTKNNKGKTAEIIDKLSSENENINIEFIVIDMNSADGVILEVLNMIKKKSLLGYVIQRRRNRKLGIEYGYL